MKSDRTTSGTTRAGGAHSMQWENIKLIFVREMRDQLRDRRTLFLIAVLPLLLYPLLGMSFFQFSQFLRTNTAKVLIVGAEPLEQIDWLPPLLEDGEFADSLFADRNEQRSIDLVWPDQLDVPADQHSDDRQPTRDELAGGDDAAADRSDSPAESLDYDAALARGRRMLADGKIQVLLEFPPDFVQGLVRAREAIEQRTAKQLPELPQPVIYANSTNEKSKIAQMRVERAMHTWRRQITEKNLSDNNVSVEATQAFTLTVRDVAEPGARRAAIWSKILPFVVLIWALTGAFYPAVDLCAGEKERGTLETLLTSPALRREIVWGKLLTVMLFSSATALLNLGSLGLTGKFVVDQLVQVPGLAEAEGLTLPPLASLGWLVAALIPISALFSALCLACAAFARSTKEGQYYLMPLMLVTMPLMLLPMSLGVELNLGNSLIPLTGLALLLRSLIEGQYLQAAPFVAPVIGVTGICCLLAIRWAEEQFNSESVLFRESERLELGRWLRSMVHNRGETPSLGQAALCFVLIATVQFFVTIALSAQGTDLTFGFLVQSIFLSQVVCILTPALLMTLLLTGSPRRTLLLYRRPRWTHLLAGVALAITVHPLAVQLGQWISQLYPMSDDTRASAEAFQGILFSDSRWWAPLLLIAVLPAICEELAFRGFILSGLRHLGHKWWAIGLSAVAFGAVHLFVQQKMSAAVIGMLLGYLAVQTSSLWPCILFHVTHNGLQLSVYKAAEAVQEKPDSFWAPLLGGDSPALYSPPVQFICLAAAAALLWSLHRISYRRTKEERLLEARERHEALAGSC